MDLIDAAENGNIKRVRELLDSGIDPNIKNDINDIEILNAVGFSAMPPNSPILNKFNPDYITKRSGGDGSFRDFVDFILSQK